MSTDHRAGFRSAWHQANFRRLLLGLVVSGTGNWLYNVALLTYVLQATGSAGWVALSASPRCSPSSCSAPSVAHWPTGSSVGAS